MKGVTFSAPSQPRFNDYPDFTPSLNPREMVERGVFGGGYFRPIYSSVTGRNETVNPQERYPRLFAGLPDSFLVSSNFDKRVNYYGAKAGSDLEGWHNFAGPHQGRFRTNLINKIKRAGARWDDTSISPVIRQGLLQWGYELTEADYLAK